MRLFLMVFVLSLVLIIGFCQSKGQKTYPPPPKGSVPIKQVFDPKVAPCMFVVPQLKPIERLDGKGKIGLKAKDCGQCHQSIYKEWSQTTHSSALNDLQFQAEIAKKDVPKWQCLNCHIPVQNQREYFITHLVDSDILKPVKKNNPGFDPEMKKEAITCATCHVRTDEKGKSFIYGAIGRSDGSNKGTNAPHPVKKDKRFLRKRCFYCHNVTKSPIEDRTLCFFTTGQEWRGGPYGPGQAGIDKDRYSGKKDCVDCHMPTTKRKIADIDTTDPDKVIPERSSHQHHWVGGGVPKSFKAYDTLIDRGFVTALKVDTSRIAKLAAGKENTFHVILENTDINGHSLPTGDGERFIVIEATLKDLNNKVLERRHYKIYREMEWSMSPPNLTDNRLEPLEKVDWKFKMKLPETFDNIQLVITALHVRLLPKTARFIKKTPNIDPLYASKTKEIENHYPFSSYLYKEEIRLKDNMRRLFKLKELIELSKKRKGKVQMEELKRVEDY